MIALIELYRNSEEVPESGKYWSTRNETKIKFVNTIYKLLIC